MKTDPFDLESIKNNLLSTISSLNEYTDPEHKELTGNQQEQINLLIKMVKAQSEIIQYQEEIINIVRENSKSSTRHSRIALLLAFATLIVTILTPLLMYIS